MGNSPGNMNGNNNNNNRRSLGNIINRVFESAGPDGKVRGTPQQIIDKYQALARDAQLAGDRVAAESFLQHSEHYSRLLGEAAQQQNEVRQTYDRDDAPRDDVRRDDDRRDEDPRGDVYPDLGRDQNRAPQMREQQPREQQPREQQSRDLQPRDQQPRDQQPREQQGRAPQPRDQQQRPQRDDQRPRPDQQPVHRPAPQPMIASSLTTIDPTDEEEDAFGGLIDTPESPVAALPLPLPVVEPPVEVTSSEGMNGAAHPVVQDEAPVDPPKPKRGRPRKKAPAPEGEAPIPPVE